ncbi:MAG: c-type cytochrome biogenesis protein CcmI [Caldimonas sp.]
MASVDPMVVARARLRRLKARNDAGKLDDRRYEDARRAIEREISDALLAGDAASSPSPRPSRRLMAALGLFVAAIAVAGYWLTGTPPWRTPAASPQLVAAEGSDAAASASIGPQQIDEMVAKLAERMKDNPDDAEGWTMLARSYTVLGRFAEALPAYERAAEQRPDSATLLADYADAVAATKGTANNPQSIALIERALKSDPKHQKALALAGTVSFDRGDYGAAIAHWQKIAEQLPPGSELMPRVQAMIDDARSRLGGSGATAGPAPASSVPPATVAAARPAASATAPAAGTSVSGTVTLDAVVAAQASPDDAVFVFARAASGSRMPLAVKRAKVKDLPLTFTLDDSMAMAPGMTLSSAPQLTVGARVSKSGNAIPQPGDLTGETTGVAPGARNLAIRIGTVVGRP